MIKQLSLPCAGRIFFGPFPEQETLMQLRAKKVTVVWNLMSELSSLFELESKLFPYAINTPIDDYSVPLPKRFLLDLKVVLAHLQAGRDVYIHCLGGHGRTGIALAALTVKLAKVSPEAALQYSVKHCQGPERELQRQFIRETL